ncbi:MAG: extracellular solute-binding protein [Bifidobacteriaceae bacterium]|jgi:raffinose/stachyose/melibiose transport system substrate-binding protein|nr:extracellular solute-binding protein [Bifidobacteriaceae bacterium]MCI1978734.1 extracellular solute-binding protein [Bifidobacteriaceae bacterium]
MRLKPFIAAAAAAATLLSMGACGNSSSSADGTDADGNVEITMWHNSTTGEGKQYYEDLAKAFEKKYPNVKISIQAIQDEDFKGKIQTALQDPDSAPDIFFQRGGQEMQNMVDANQLLDLTDVISSETKEAVGSAIDAGSIDGKVYGLPFTVTPGGMWYSKDLFKQAGISEPPTTWDELKTDITKLKDAGIAPVALGAKDAWPAAHWWYWSALRECSTDTFNKAMESKNFDDECWERAGKDVQEIQKLDAFNDGYLTTSAQQGANSSAGLLANHKAAMELMGAWEPGVLKDLTADKKEMADLGYFQFPSIDGGEGDAKALMGGADSFSCGAWAPKKVCGEFLDFLLTKDNQEAWVKAFSAPPANKEAQSAVTGDALKEALDAYNNSSSYSMWLDTLFGTNVGNALNSSVVNMLAGKGTPADITKAATDAAAKG